MPTRDEINYKEFSTSDNTASYTSATIHRDPHQNRTSVFQAKIPAGDTLVLQGRVDSELPFVDILTVVGQDVLQEVVTAAEFRVVVTNTSGQAVIAAMTI